MIKILEKSVRKEKNRQKYRLRLSYLTKDGGLRSYSLLENSREKAKNTINFRLAALTSQVESVDVSQLIR